MAKQTREGNSASLHCGSNMQEPEKKKFQRVFQSNEKKAKGWNGRGDAGKRSPAASVSQNQRNRSEEENCLLLRENARDAATIGKRERLSSEHVNKKNLRVGR